MSEQGKEFNLKVCTPKGVFLEERVREVTLPAALVDSSNGQIGILPGHAAYTGLVGTGMLEYVPEEGKSPHRFVISGGFSSFNDNTLLLLTDTADSLSTVDKDQYAAKRSELTKILSEHIVDSPEWNRARVALSRIEAIDELVSH